MAARVDTNIAAAEFSTVNYRQIETFAAIMRSGTASRAAEILGITQPAVSRSVAELEKAVGFPLFARVRNRLVPTPEAGAFFRDVEASYCGLDTLRASAARIRDHGSGQIRIASLSALGSSLVPRAIRRFRDHHPDVAVTLIVTSSRSVRDVVAAGEFDIGLAADEIDVTGVVGRLAVDPRGEFVGRVRGGDRLQGTLRGDRPARLGDSGWASSAAEGVGRIDSYHSRQRRAAAIFCSGVAGSGGP